MLKRIIFVFCYISITIVPATSGEGNNEPNQIILTDLADYFTLKYDFHIHTIFTDGLVWLTVREDEALRWRLYAISIDDHIEYQPHKKDVNTGYNRSYEIVSKYAEKKKKHIQGMEIIKNIP